MFPTPPFDTSGSLIPLGEWGGGEAGRERPEQRRKEMPGIDPPGLARLQEIPVREKCCGLEHLFSFHGGMKPRLSGKGGGKEEERKRKMTLFCCCCCQGGAASQWYGCLHHRLGCQSLPISLLDGGCVPPVG